MTKTFTGDWIIVIILLIVCWPVAVIYLLMKYEEVPPYGPPGAPPTGGPAPGGAYGPHGGMRVCGACGSSYDYSKDACPYCGKPSYYANASPPYDHSVKYCPNCRGPNDMRAEYCSKCGTKL